MSVKKKILIPLLSLVLVATSVAAAPSTPTLTETKNAIQDKEKEINELEKKISELKAKRDTTAEEASLIDAQVDRLQQSQRKAELELTQTSLQIAATKDAQEESTQALEDLTQKIAQTKQRLRTLLQQLYLSEQESLMKIFLSNLRLSEVLAEQAAYRELHDHTAAMIKQLHEEEAMHKERVQELAQQETDLSSLHQLQYTQQQDIAEHKKEQENFLKKKQGEQATYEHLLADAKQARQEIEQQVYSLKNTGITITLNDAFSAARYAGSHTGVRPALLLAVLKVETNLGERLGSGTFPDDMHPASREAFLRITKKLGIDPHTAPISARPKSFQGWGGAMGPAQFMPQTWEGIEGRVAAAMGKTIANPYELSDAFVATAILLADKGGSNKAQEYEAVNRYIAGPNWQNFTWYGDRVLAVAKEYEKEGV